MIQVGETVLLSNAEQERIWNSIHFLWSYEFLEDSSPMLQGWMNLQSLAGVHCFTPQSQTLLDSLRENAWMILNDESWIIHADWSDEQDSDLSPEQIYEIEIALELLKELLQRMIPLEAGA